MSTDSMPMYDSLARDIEHLILAGATYKDASGIGAEVLDLLDVTAARFLGYTDQERHSHVLWIAHTHLMDAWNRTPRLLFVSPEPNCGKTTALEITQRLVPRAPDVISNLTGAAFYQVVQDSMKDKGGRPTILHDQLDKLFGNAEYGRRKNADVENLIETGFQRGGTIRRTINRKSTPFNVYAAVALAGAMDVRYVPDAIISRSITIHLQRALPGEVPQRWQERVHAPELESLCWLLRCWVELIHTYALEYVPDIPDSLNNRDIDKWEPLLAMADLAGGNWPEYARVASVASVAGWHAASPSEGEQLLWAIQDTFDKHGDKIHTETLMPELFERGFRWAGRPIRESSLHLAGLLRAYGIAPRSVRIGPKSVRGFRREWFEEAWLRYPPPPPDPEDDWDDDQPATPATPTTGTDHE